MLVRTKIMAVAVSVWCILSASFVTARESDGRLNFYILAAAKYHNLDPALLHALVWQESRRHPKAISPKGAIGYTQLMPGTAREIGVNPHDPWHNVFGGAKYLREMLNRHNNNVPLALAAYNAGPARVKTGEIPNIRETKLYVTAVIHYWGWFRRHMGKDGESGGMS